MINNYIYINISLCLDRNCKLYNILILLPIDVSIHLFTLIFSRLTRISNIHTHLINSDKIRMAPPVKTKENSSRQNQSV